VCVCVSLGWAEDGVWTVEFRGMHFRSTEVAHHLSALPKRILYSYSDIRNG
jgi:hypothetical protein